MAFWHRSSDTVDFERTTTLRELQELRIEEEGNKSGGLEQETSPNPAIPASSAIANFNTHANLPVQPIEDSSPLPLISVAKEKIVVFRDEDVPWTKTGAKIVHRVASIPAKSLDFHYGVTSSPPVGSTNDIGSNETKAQDVNTSEYQSPVMRLRFLAAKRADLLEKLDRLAVEERQILNKLNERNKRLRGFTLTLWDDSRRSEATAMRMSPSRIPVLSSLRKSCVPLRDIALLPDSRVQSHAKNEKLVGCKKRKPLGSIRSEESGIPRPRIVRPCGQRRM